MAWRDGRRTRRRLLLYSASIVLGVAALVAIGSFGENLRAAVEDQAKTLVGADLVIASNGEFSPEEKDFLRSLGGVQAREISLSSMVFFPRSGGTRLVQVRGVEPGFPFYGSLETSPRSASALFRSGLGALVEEGVMQQYGLRVGDGIKIGTTMFEIRGSLLKVPGETAAFMAMAPRVYVAFADLEQTGLLQKGSLVRHRVYYQFGDEVRVPALVKKIQPTIDRFNLAVDTVEHRKRELGRAMDNLYHFLNLVGFIALLLGGIGIASAIHVHVKQKLSIIAILRSLGATAPESFGVYFSQAASLGLVGVTAGALIGIGLQALLPRVLADFLPIRFNAAISWTALGRGTGLGLGVCLLFALLPLIRVRQVTPLAVLRAGVEPATPARRDPMLWGVYVALVVGIVAFSLSQTGDWRVGLGFAGGLAAAFACLTGLAYLVSRIVKQQVPRVHSFVWRQGLSSLFRPGNRTVLLMLCLGLGTFLVLTLYLLQISLVDGLLPERRPTQPDAVLFDIQPDQRDGVKQSLKAQGLPVLQDVPVVTMRLAQIKGRSVERLRRDPRREIPNWALRREYRSTYRDHLVDSERLLRGALTARAPLDASPIPVSVEEGIAKTLQIGLGDELVFDVQGVAVKTIVASLREVDWRRLQPNFFVIFPIGVLEDAPTFHVIVTRAGSSSKSAQMQQEMVKRFPNVSVIDLSLVLKTLDGILSKISFVIRFMALFTVGTGLIVLVASILTGRFQRLQESVLLRTLGATRRQILQMLLVEYFCLGTLAAATGVILAVAASWGLAQFVFKSAFTFSLYPLAIAWATVSLLTILTGLVTSRGICTHPPLEVLRGE